jgi:serine/threonine protein kinase
MSHPATSQFFDGIRAARLLDDTRIKELESRPEAVWGDAVSLSNYAIERGWLTAYQAQELREGRGAALNVAGYQVFDKLDDSPAGTTYKVLHPALQQPVSLRILRSEWLAPADTPGEYVARVQAASLVQSPHLANVLDAGTFEQSPFIVQEYVDGCDLYRMVNEMGALPLGLACEYVRQAALALKAAHEKGLVHGVVSPHALVLSPVKRATGTNGDVSIRPRPGATSRLTEFGVSPRRPPIGDLSYGESDRLPMVAFLPPERLTSGELTPAGDLYGLGATLYFLLTTRPPHGGESPVEVLLNLQQAEPAPVESLRAETPPAVAALIQRLLSRYPTMRPSAAEVIETITPYCEKSAMPEASASVLLANETFTQPGVPTAVPVARNLDRPPAAEDDAPFAAEIPPSSDAPPLVEPLPDDHHGLVPEIAPLDDHHGHGHEEHFGHTAIGADAPRAPRPKTRITQKQKMLLIAGLCLHLTATCLCLGAFNIIPNPFFSRSPSTEQLPHPEKEKKDTTTKTKRKG